MRRDVGGASGRGDVRADAAEIVAGFRVFGLVEASEFARHATVSAIVFSTLLTRSMPP